MRYAALFLALAGVLAAVAGSEGGLAWLLIWPSACSLVVSLGYAGVGPGVFGKRADGTLPVWSLMFHLPFYLCLWSAWHLLRRVNPEPSHHELLPGVLIGRRLLPAEIPDGVAVIVDLTAEFREPAGVRAGRQYWSLPILDTRAPSPKQLTELVERLSGCTGTIYLHCAEGHGRTGLVAAALLLRRGEAADWQEALQRVREKRPGVHLSRTQRATLERWAAQRSSAGLR